MSEETNKPDFDSVKQLNPYGVEYWSARELLPLLGYTSWQNFDKTIRRAMISCEQAGQVVADHFNDAIKVIEAGKGAKQKLKDYSLSRLACYLIAMNGDPRKPEIAAAQNYFAVAARTNELHQLRQQQERRLELRERVTEGNKALAEAASDAGVLRPSFGKFQNAGYQGLYGGLDLEEIKARKGINSRHDLLDNIGLAELGANALRIGLTEQKLRDGGFIGESQAIQTHHDVGREIRSAIERVGSRMPEDLPAEPSIKPLIDQKKRNQKKALPVSKKNESDSPNDAEGQEVQKTLFDL